MTRLKVKATCSPVVFVALASLLLGAVLGVWLKVHPVFEHVRAKQRVGEHALHINVITLFDQGHVIQALDGNAVVLWEHLAFSLLGLVVDDVVPRLREHEVETVVDVVNVTLGGVHEQINLACANVGCCGAVKLVVVHLFDGYYFA
jgi:hypothetical protein